MRILLGAALALLSAASLAQPITDLALAAPIEGNWSYTATADGSEAVFSNTLSVPQLWVHCTRATRRVTVAKQAGAPASSMIVWTSSRTRDVPSNFNPATGRLTIDLAPFDSLLDAIATSRGRIALTSGGQPPLVVPAWAEAAHVIEDCRA